MSKNFCDSPSVIFSQHGTLIYIQTTEYIITKTNYKVIMLNSSP